ncbi:MAG: zinc ribbon domain-containing protein [Thermoleophilia bacterium]
MRVDEVVADPNRRCLDGEIIRVSGISGVASGACALLFERDLVILMIGSVANHWTISYEEIEGLQFGGPGAVSKKSGGGWMGGGFGLAGVLEGVAVAGAMNALTSKTTLSIESIISFRWGACQLEFLHTQFAPNQLSEIFAPVIARIESIHATSKVRVAPDPAVELKACPDCAEHVRVAARKCRFCGYVFNEDETH